MLDTARKLPGFLWNNSPRQVVGHLKRYFTPQSRSSSLNRTQEWKYPTDLLDLFWSFIDIKFPGCAMPRDEFMSIVQHYLWTKSIRQNNTYFGDLWRLFAPDYRSRMPQYYEYHQFHLAMTFLDYATRSDLVLDTYVHPYVIARERLGELQVLELGGGIPHGLIHETLYGPQFCKAVTLVEIESVYARFVEWFCHRFEVPFTLVVAQGAKSVALPPQDAYNFVFAKDVFEHLERPDNVLQEVLTRVSEDAILALDVQDRGAAIYQHINTDLSPLRQTLSETGFEAFSSCGNVTMFGRATTATGS